MRHEGGIFSLILAFQLESPRGAKLGEGGKGVSFVVSGRSHPGHASPSPVEESKHDYTMRKDMAFTGPLPSRYSARGEPRKTNPSMLCEMLLSKILPRHMNGCRTCRDGETERLYVCSLGKLQLKQTL